MSKSLSVLRAAASQVAHEEQQEGLDGMLKAADEIANERGLSSPLRKSPNKENLFNAFGSGQQDDSNRFSPRNIGVDKQPADDAESDALALLKQMNIEPKISATVGFADDVQALLAHSAGEINKAETMPISSSTRSSLARQRYKKKISRLGNKSLHSSTASSRGLSLTSEPAEVAQLLSLADDKPYAESIRQSFRTEIEEMLFRSTFLIQRPLSGSSRHFSSASTDTKLRYDKMRKSADRLSATQRKEPQAWEKKKDKTMSYLTYDEAKECTFRPHLRSSKKASKHENAEEDGAKEDPRFSFISRQEAEERNRREELLFNMGKKDYDALVDKKVCPQCGAKQSYDEVKEKRKVCPTCRVEYSNPLTWGKVRGRFWKKCSEFSHRVALHREQIMLDIENEYKFVIKAVVDENGKVMQIREPRSRVLTEEEEQDFFRRIEEKLLEKEEKRKRLEREIYEEKYTFKPEVKQYRDPSRGSDDELESNYSDDEKNEVRAFLKRYEEDMEHRREKMPQKYLRSRRSAREREEKEMHSEPFKV